MAGKKISDLDVSTGLALTTLFEGEKIGSPNKSEKYTFQEVADLILPLTFRSTMAQTSTSAPAPIDLYGDPAATPVIDSIGGAWSYSTTGKYRYIKAGAFANKTKVLAYTIPSPKAEGADAYAEFTLIDDDTIELEVGRLSNFSGAATATPTNGVLYREVIIEIYS